MSLERILVEIEFNNGNISADEILEKIAKIKSVYVVEDHVESSTKNDCSKDEYYFDNQGIRRKRGWHDRGHTG